MTLVLLNKSEVEGLFEVVRTDIYLVDEHLNEYAMTDSLKIVLSPHIAGRATPIRSKNSSAQGTGFTLSGEI